MILFSCLTFASVDILIVVMMMIMRTATMVVMMVMMMMLTTTTTTMAIHVDPFGNMQRAMERTFRCIIFFAIFRLLPSHKSTVCIDNANLTLYLQALWSVFHIIYCLEWNALYHLKPTSQYNINRAVAARFWPDFGWMAIFEIRRSPADFLDLEQSRKLTQWSPDNHRRATVRPPADFILKWPNFRPMSLRCPGSDRPDSQLSLLGVLLITAGRQWILRSPAVHLRVTGRSPAGVLPICAGFGWDSLWYKYLHRNFNLLTIVTRPIVYYFINVLAHLLRAWTLYDIVC